jgi:N-acetylglucosaminyl-diphospho-decaprenol L-rhamnosyltransferase
LSWLGEISEDPAVTARLDLVVVHRDEPDRVVETISGFVRQDDPVRILVVDNGSPPEQLVDLCRKLPDGVGLLPLGDNRGFGPAANVGWQWFLDRPDPADWLAVAPHDASAAVDCVSVLLAELSRHPQAGLASADVGDGLTPTVDRYIGAIPTPARVVRGWEPAGYPHGTLLVARRACLEDVGMFDERYFAYCEEADLALRVRRAGWQVGVVRGAEVRNRHIGSHVAVIDYLQLRNTLLLVRDHFGRYPVTVRSIMALWQLLAGALVPSCRGPYWDPPARIRALRDFLRGRFGPPPTEIMRRSATSRTPRPRTARPTGVIGPG